MLASSTVTVKWRKLAPSVLWASIALERRSCTHGPPWLTEAAQHMRTRAALRSSVVGLVVEYLDLNRPPMAAWVVFPFPPLRGFSWSIERNSSRVILLRAVLAPEVFPGGPLEDAEDEDRARLEMPDEMLERTEAHDRRLADFVDPAVEEAREGDFSWRYASEAEPLLMACGVDPGDSDCLTVIGLSVEGLGVKKAGCGSMGGCRSTGGRRSKGGRSTDMRVPGVSHMSWARMLGGRLSRRRRTLRFRILRSALTDLRKRTRINMVARSLGLQSSILRSGRRFLRCL